MEHSEYRTGDFIVGSYSGNGSQIKPGKIHGDKDEIEVMQSMILEHGGRTGGRPLPVATPKKGPKGKKKIVKTEVEESDYDEAPKSFFSPEDEPKQYQPVYKAPQKAAAEKIFLYNQMGKIKLNVATVLDSEMAFCVVFEHEDDMIFTPKPGETLTMVDPQGQEHSVYFADSVFTWMDGIKQLMILFKTSEKE